jgi:hypothetical protein
MVKPASDTTNSTTVTFSITKRRSMHPLIQPLDLRWNRRVCRTSSGRQAMFRDDVLLAVISRQDY